MFKININFNLFLALFLAFNFQIILYFFKITIKFNLFLELNLVFDFQIIKFWLNQFKINFKIHFLPLKNIFHSKDFLIIK